MKLCRLACRQWTILPLIFLTLLITIFFRIVIECDQKVCTTLKVERAMGLEPTTFSLATRRSTTELCPHLILRLIIVQCLLCLWTQLILKRICHGNQNKSRKLWDHCVSHRVRPTTCYAWVNLTQFKMNLQNRFETVDLTGPFNK